MERIKSKLNNFSPRSFAINNAAFIMCLVLFVYNAVFRANFLRVNTLWNILAQSATLTFAAMGMTIVISAGCTDLSISSMLAVSSSITGMLYLGGWSLGLAVTVALAVCLALGFVNGFLVAKLKMQPMVAMLVTRMVYRAAINIYTKGITKNINSTGIIRIIGKGRIDVLLRMPVIIIPTVLIVLITLFIVKKTKFGKEVEAVGNNQRTAYLCGISVAGTIFGVYILSALFAGMGGILELFRSAALDSNSVGTDYEMTAIAAATIGGTSMRGGKARVFGTVFGVLLMTLITMTVNFANLPFELNNVLKAFIIIGAISLQQMSNKV